MWTFIPQEVIRMWRRLLTERGNPHFSVLRLLLSLQPYSTSSCKKGQRKIESRSKETSLKMMQCREIGPANYSQEIQMLAGLLLQHFSHHYRHHPSKKLTEMWAILWDVGKGQIERECYGTWQYYVSKYFISFPENIMKILWVLQFIWDECVSCNCICMFEV